MDHKSHLIYASTFEVDHSTSRLGKIVIQVFEILGLVQVKRNKKTNTARVSNLTLINLILVKFGPMSEQNAAIAVVFVQVVCSMFAYIVRYGLVHVVYNAEN